jgi:hypothetical protein
MTQATTRLTNKLTRSEMLLAYPDGMSGETAPGRFSMTNG